MPSSPLRTLRLLLGAVAIFVVSSAPMLADDNPLNDARRLYLTGRYEEAEEIYNGQLRSHRVNAAIGLARCQAARGEYDDALRVLHAANPKDQPLVRAEISLLQSPLPPYQPQRSRRDDDTEPPDDDPAMLWAKAQWLQATGKADETANVLKTLVDKYDKPEQITDPDTLRYIGLAIAEQARLDGDPEKFRLLVNQLYPQALALDKNFWPAHLEAGMLYLEKFNLREATSQFNKALAINPNAAEVHAARAELALQSYDLERAKTSIDRALEINPRLRQALQWKADLLMAGFQVDEAIDVLKNEAMPRHAHHDEVRGRLAAAYGYADGLNRSEEELARSRMQQMVFESIKLNPHCGRFFLTMGDTFDLMRKYPHAAQQYAEAERRSAGLIDVSGKLGMVQMRLGNETEAKRLLERSFKLDPFNVRVKNTLEVLDVLENYAVIETEHFVIKFDRGQDQMLAEYAAQYLEENVYPQIVKEMGYTPPDKTLFEIFSRAKNTSGHGWFSARMVGLPYIGTVGACAGQMVAIASPNDMPEPYNWARVLKHEFVHVVNLQQTDFNIPHWFTEALAVRSEGYPRPPDWTQLLARRHAEETLFTLADINSGFLRPGAGDDWTLAYCQAEIYAEYMVERFGDDAPAKLLASYRDNLDTEAAIRHSFTVSQEDFEKEYRDHITKLVTDVDVANPPAARLAASQKAVAEDPDNPILLAELSYALLQRQSAPDARRYALQALELDDKQQLAAYVMARLHLLIGDTPTALKYLRDSFQEASPQKNHLALLAGLLLRAKQTDDAQELYELGAKTFPHDPAWMKRLASLYLKSGDDEKLADVLTQLTQLDTESLAFRTKLAQLAIERKDFAAAEHWATEALYVNIKSAPLHVLRADALAAQNKHAGAAKEFAYALQLQPDQLAWRLRLAQMLFNAGDVPNAKLELEKVTDANENFPGARELQRVIEEK